MKFSPKSIKQLLRESRKGIYNSIDNEFILPLVQEFGYTNEYLTEATQLHRNVEASLLERDNKLGMKVAESIRLVAAVDQIYKRTTLYVLHLKRDFKNSPDLMSEYKLNAVRPKTTTERLEYSKAFYRRCKDIEGLGTHVVAYGLTPERLDGLQADIVKIEQDEDYRSILKKDTETSTVARNKLAEQLYDTWMKYKATMIFVLKDDPQQLEAFGITSYSEGYRPKKKNGSENNGEQNEDPTDDNTGESTGESDTTSDNTGDAKDRQAAWEKKKEKEIPQTTTGHGANTPAQAV